MSILDLFSGPSPEDAAKQARSAAIKAAGLSDRQLLTPEQERLVSLTQSSMYGAPMTDEERQQLKLLNAQNIVRKGDEQDARNRSVGKHYLNAAHSLSESQDPMMVPMLGAKAIGNLTKEETGSPVAGLVAELATASPTGTANLIKSTGKTMARIPTSIQEARAMLMAGTAGAEELAAARKLVQEMSNMPRAASIGEEVPGLTRPMIDAKVAEGRAPMQTGSMEDAMRRAEQKAQTQKLVKTQAKSPPSAAIPDRRQTGMSPDIQKAQQDAAAKLRLREQSAAADAALAKAQQEAEQFKGSLRDKAASEQRKAMKKEARDVTEPDYTMPEERPVPSDLNTPIEPKVSQEDLAKNVFGKDAPVEDVTKVKPSEVNPKDITKKPKKPMNPLLKTTLVGAGIAAVPTVIGALGSKSDRGKPAATPPPDKGGVAKPEAVNPNLSAEADNTADRGLSREEELKQQAAAQALRPEASPEEKALKTKQEAFDAVMAEGNALDKEGKGGFWRGVGKFFGDKGPEDFFSYVSDTKGYLAKEAQRAKEARMAGNLAETTKINEGIARLKAAENGAAAVNANLMKSLRDNNTRRYVAELRQKQGEQKTALAVKMATIPAGTKLSDGRVSDGSDKFVDWEKVPGMVMKLSAAESGGKLQGALNALKDIEE